jgi:undecaprenyl-diphosphatase
MRDVTALGSISVLSLVIAAVAGYCLLAGDRAAMWTMLLAGTGGLILTFLLKEVLGRTRPDVVPHLTEVSTASFPSGHSMVSAAVYLTLGVLLAQWVEGRPLKSYFIGIALIVTLLVGISRVYLGVHYPTDVLAGWMAGAVWAILCGLAARQVTARKKRSVK